ncbi:hypothetical protein SAMN04515665_11121 [Blastococcus sp. DSM 46786]|uniref:hypothetical protein n=1 Tax=Blastococcus sp. DSM 46786 TaxID=1798227 RepID=UPI0008BE6327|nr:hypothetical protein [Blastococcus sp. DSM 46786]SEL31543.1 hypothetical protein SAMN04515665_11121 [Blastococcus sp. DSM 46786]
MTAGAHRAALLLLGTALLAGCGQPVVLGEETLACERGDEGHPANGVVLMAQSVPSAGWVPCLEAMPLGWDLAGLEADETSARFWLDSDRDGVRALEVALTASCDTTAATEIPSEREGMRRWERVGQVSPRYVGTRYYVFAGGCVSVLFRLSGENRSEPLAVATQGIGAVTRDQVRAAVLDQTDGELQLDPPAGGR